MFGSIRQDGTAGSTGKQGFGVRDRRAHVLGAHVLGTHVLGAREPTPGVETLSRCRSCNFNLSVSLFRLSIMLLSVA